MKNLTKEECLQWVTEAGIPVDHGVPALGPDDSNSQTMVFGEGLETNVSKHILERISAESNDCVLVWITDWPFATEKELFEFEGRFLYGKGRLIELPGILSSPSELLKSSLVKAILTNSWDAYFVTRNKLVAYSNHEGFAYVY